MDLTDIVVSSFAVLSLLGQAIVAFLLALLLVRPDARVLGWMRANALTLMLIVALLATGGSLYFSDIAGWTPCKDCWIQRIFMYPQVVLLLIAIWRRDRGIAYSILALSILGAAVAAHHYSEQVSAALYPPDTAVPCDDSGVSCASTPFFHFGYITIPLMAFTAFLLNILGSILLIRTRASSGFVSRS